MQTDLPAIKTMIESLGSNDLKVRQHAYESLVSVGKPAVTLLAEALENRREQVRHEAASALGEIGDPAAIPSLASMLGNKDGVLRKHARDALVAMSKLAVPALIEASADKNKEVRWEAAKALGEIGDPTAAPVLVKMMTDKEFEVRWLAAEGLIVMDREGLLSLLRELELQTSSLYLQDSVHLVIRNLAEEDRYAEILSPVLKAMEGLESALTVPLAARAALKKL